MKVHVLCPASSATGGPEALHQFVDAGRELGFDMAMVYLPEDAPDPTPAAFRRYAPPVARQVVDAPDSVVVVPETATLKLLELRHARRALWWLSVEQFEMRADAFQRCAGSAQSPLDFVFDARLDIVHLAQSEYARQWVANRGAPAAMLTDYIGAEIVARARILRAGGGGPREDVVAYNPAKGLAFTRRLMAASPPHIRWVAIENMTPAEVAQQLGRAKVYVDFGPHPGRDRIPREAALCGCVVITNTRGSAGNDIDVPLPQSLKFDESHPQAVPRVLQRIAEAVADPAPLAAQLTPYRDRIEGQRQAFREETFRLLSTLEAGLADRAVARRPT